MFREIRATARSGALAVLLIASFLVRIPVTVAQDMIPPSSELLPRIVVSATRVPTPENEVASSITLISAADIEAQQARTLPDILATVRSEERRVGKECRSR